ncbi:STAS domain-containing protein [Mycobacterium sp. 155]|uniref:STAS domain-containing protein n=1 Tax=Mycobacterium sp. 155 TaxID=1157943 RepID=UPI00036827AB|nr:STAS domain-containing protein [Mycobacterium sp. 155]
MSNQPDPVESPGGPAGPVSCAVGERRIGEIAVLSVSGTVDMLTAPQLEEAIGVATKTSPSAVVVDLSGVEFLASAGMGVLVAARNALAPAVRFAVVADGPATSRPLKLVGVADVIDLYATLDEALTALTA